MLPRQTADHGRHALLLHRGLYDDEVARNRTLESGTMCAGDIGDEQAALWLGATSAAAERNTICIPQLYRLLITNPEPLYYNKRGCSIFWHAPFLFISLSFFPALCLVAYA